MWIPDFATAVKIAERPDLPPRTRLIAADVLVAHGHLDAGERLLDETGNAEGLANQISVLRSASAELRAFDVPRKLADMGPAADQLNGAFELTAVDRVSVDRTIVVFTDVTRRFWLSLAVLHLFLEPLRARIIYLRDARNQLFLSGLAAIGGNYPAMLAHLHAWLPPGAGSVAVTGSSAGGYIGLRAAADLRADAFVGFSIRSDLSPGSGLPLNGKAAEVRAAGVRPEMLVNLLAYLRDREAPGRIALHAGMGNPVDVAHAAHLRSLDRVRLDFHETKSHNVVQHLVAKGLFGSALADLFPNR